MTIVLYFSIFNTTGMSHLKITNCLYFLIYPCKTLPCGAFAYCLRAYLLSYPTSLIPFQFKRALLWQFNNTDNNKIYFDLHGKY